MRILADLDRRNAGQKDCFLTLLDHIEEAAHDDGAEEVLKGHEGIRDAQQQSGQLKMKNIFKQKYGG